MKCASFQYLPWSLADRQNTVVLELSRVAGGLQTSSRVSNDLAVDVSEYRVRVDIKAVHCGYCGTISFKPSEKCGCISMRADWVRKFQHYFVRQRTHIAVLRLRKATFDVNGTDEAVEATILKQLVQASVFRNY
jgi:hypothetical protein